MVFLLKYWKLIVLLLLVFSALGTLGLAIRHYHKVVADNETLKAENQRQADDLQDAKDHAEQVQKAVTQKQKNDQKTKTLSDPAIDEQLGSDNWLRSD